MTREEAIKWLKDMLKNFDLPMEQYQTALDMAIKALEQEPTDDATLKDIFCMGCEYKEQEPCEDAISRQAVLDGIEELKRSPWCTDKRNGYEYLIAEALDVIKDLCIKQEPPVNPQVPKTGHWIGDNQAFWIYAKCSECGSVHNTATNYCPDCGCLMDRTEFDEYVKTEGA